MEFDEYTEDWSASIHMDYNGLKMLYDFVCWSIITWPGAPARPIEEQQMLQNLKIQLFSLMMEYNLTELD